MNAKPLSLSLALVVALAACAKQDAPVADAPAPAAKAETASAATTAPQAAPADDAAFELTMDKVDGFLAATKQLAAAEQDDPSLDSAMNASQEDGTQFAARLEATPKLREAIERAGLSTRDYALTSEALIATLMAVGAQEAGMLEEIPAALPAQHVEFVKAHRAEIEKKLQAAGATEG